ncbi:MAG TPA: TonB-dependent receptor [Rhizomicrobium sp.]|nr:TonB-dependent receptor [Rhizomicrobium sp.]
MDFSTVRRLAAALLAAASLALPAAAAADSETVIVTATRLPGSIAAGDPNVSVIDAAEIAARHASSAVELLRSLPGVFVQQAGGRGSVVSLFVRGAKPNFTLVLIDGVKVNDPTNSRGGSFDFSTLDIDDIERVELVRGPASMVYGSDAIGGVINFVTRRAARETALDLDVAAGAYGFKHVAGHVGGALGPLAARGGIAYTDNGVPVAGSLFHGTTFDGALSGGWADGLTLALSGRYSLSRVETFPDSSGGPALAVIRDVDRRTIDEGVLGGHANYADSGAWSFALDYGLYDRTSNARSPGVAPSAQTPSGIPPNTDNVHFLRNTLTGSARFAPSAAFEVAFGFDVQVEHGVDIGTLKFGPVVIPTSFRGDRTLVAGFAQARYAPLPGLALSAGGRYDKPDDQGGHFSPQARADYTLAPTQTTFDVSWGLAYKLPSFYALGNPIVGDPTLKSESASNLELGLAQKFAGSADSFKLDVFDTHYSNLIDFKPGAAPKLVNLSKVRIEGVEASAELHLGDTLSFTPALSYTHTRNAATGAALRDVPGWLASGVLAWTPLPALTLSVTLLHVGSFTDNAVPTGDVVLPGHQRVDLAVSWRLERGTLFVGIENATDARYQDAIGFPAPGIVARTGYSVAL